MGEEGMYVMYGAQQATTLHIGHDWHTRFMFQTTRTCRIVINLAYSQMPVKTPNDMVLNSREKHSDSTTLAWESLFALHDGSLSDFVRQILARKIYWSQILVEAPTQRQGDFVTCFCPNERRRQCSAEKKAKVYLFV